MKSSIRIQEIDALRGIALFGILLVNIFIFHAPYSYYNEFYSSFSGVQAIFVESVVMFASGKFLFLFAFLFGYGIELQKQSQQGQFNSYFSKRMLILLLIGLIHLLFFWFGDILISYALLGILILPTLKLSNNNIIALGVFFILFRPLYYVFAIKYNWPMVEMGKPVEMDKFISTFQQGNFIKIFKLRMNEFVSFIPENLVWYIPKTLGLFFIGIYSARVNIIKKIKNHTKFYVFISILFITLSILWETNKIDFFSNIDMVRVPMYRPMLIAINVVFESLLGFGYIFGYIALFQNNRTISRYLSATGRLALTNYITQSLLCVLIFYSYGFGLYAKLSPSDLVIISTLIFSLNVFFSFLYLKKHRYGPLEYYWRNLSK